MTSGPIGSREEGAALVLSVLVLLVAMAVAALALDLGEAVTVRNRAQAAADAAALAALAHLYEREYEPPTLDGLPNDGPRLDRARSAAREIAARYAIGHAQRLVRPDGSEQLAGGPFSPVKLSPPVPYRLDGTDFELLPENRANDPRGDLVLGRFWRDATHPEPGFRAIDLAAGDPKDPENLAHALRVRIRRTATPGIPGVALGGNPVPLRFARALFFTDPSGARTGREIRDRGLAVGARATALGLPAGIVGVGRRVLRREPDGTERLDVLRGYFPIAIRYECWRLGVCPDGVEGELELAGTRHDSLFKEAVLARFSLDPVPGVSHDELIDSYIRLYFPDSFPDGTAFSVPPDLIGGPPLTVSHRIDWMPYTEEILRTLGLVRWPRTVIAPVFKFRDGNLRRMFIVGFARIRILGVEFSGERKRLFWEKAPSAVGETATVARKLAIYDDTTEFSARVKRHMRRPFPDGTCLGTALIDHWADQFERND